jgi:predicted deacetylase
MAEPGSASGSLMLVLHDIAPETWPDYQPFVQAVDEMGNVPTIATR